MDYTLVQNCCSMIRLIGSYMSETSICAPYKYCMPWWYSLYCNITLCYIFSPLSTCHMIDEFSQLLFVLSLQSSGDWLRRTENEKADGLLRFAAKYFTFLGFENPVTKIMWWKHLDILWLFRQVSHGEHQVCECQVTQPQHLCHPSETSPHTSLPRV